jgi:hypothetical protein
VVISEHCNIGAYCSLDRLSVGIEQQLGWIAQMTLDGIPRAVNPVSIPLAWDDAGQVPVPDEPVHLTQGEPALGSVVVEQAQLDPLGDLREEGEI